jgi:hypothetical protein
MDTVFDINGKGEITIAPEILMVEEFAEIWNRDTSFDKLEAKRELTFVFGMSSDSEKNIWRDFREPVKRAKIIREDVYGKNSSWKPDIVVTSAIGKYKARLPHSVLDDMIESVEDAIHKLTLYLRSVDFDERDMNGKPVHDPKKVRDIMSNMGKTIADYNELKRQVKAGKVDEAVIRGGGKKGMMETADDFKDFV